MIAVTGFTHNLACNNNCCIRPQHWQGLETLLLYYQNRLVPFAVDVCGSEHESAAREIAQLGVTR